MPRSRDVWGDGRHRTGELRPLHSGGSLEPGVPGAMWPMGLRNLGFVVGDAQGSCEMVVTGWLDGVCDFAGKPEHVD